MQTPDHGRFPAVPFCSGKRASSRRKNGGRLNRVAVFSNPFTSMGSHACGKKNAGPSGGPNLNGAPTALSFFSRCAWHHAQEPRRGKANDPALKLRAGGKVLARARASSAARNNERPSGKN